MRLDELADLCLDVQREAAERNEHLPARERAREAMRAVLRVAATRAPGIARHLEAHAEPLRIDETLLPRLRGRARATIEAVAREASAATGGDVTPELLVSKYRYRWLTSWRQEAWDQLARAGMSVRDIGLVFAGRSGARISEGIASRRARDAAAQQQQEARDAVA